MREAGVERAIDPRTKSRPIIAAIVAEIEAGATVAAAVRRSPISLSAFQAGLKRHSDLADRSHTARTARHAGDVPISRNEARERGMTRYYTGKPCFAGHVGERKVADGSCFECQRIREQRRRATQV